ncbi:hypothetical protein DRO97_07330 [Archaeoglobales archaeon]|nr:MAG: hypothetical protein DRO97_07330 [Archaeoglobales archaeon]
MFFTDWEGPWILTDFAYELTIAIFNNSMFFEKLSKYDDYLAYEVKKEEYEAGDTLKLLAPFLVAAEVKSEEVKKIAESVAKFVPDSNKAMEFLQQKYKPVVISTSYTQYLTKTANMIGVKGYLHGTEIDFEKYELSDNDKKEILNAVDRIGSLNDDELTGFLDEFFWVKLQKTNAGKILNEIKAIGGERKKEIVKSYVEEFNIERIVAIGDSISDYKMLDWVRKQGGLAVSFNGNEYALKYSNLAVVSNSAISESLVVDLFIEGGFEKVREINNELKHYPIEIRQLFLNSNTNLYFLDEVDYREVLEESMNMRRSLRGQAGELG